MLPTSPCIMGKVVKLLEKKKLISQQIIYFYNVFLVYNRPFTSYSKPLFQNETKREAIDVTMIFYSHAQKTYFHKKGLSISLVLKQRLGVTLTTYLMSVAVWACHRVQVQRP